MKKLLITIVLFLLALTVVAGNSLYAYIDQIPNLKEGLPEMAPVQINDFSTILATTPTDTTRQHSLINSTDNERDYSASWYRADFAEDPFDGRIELIFGEPLPTPLTTLLVAFVTVGISLFHGDIVLRLCYYKGSNYWKQNDSKHI